MQQFLKRTLKYLASIWGIQSLETNRGMKREKADAICVEKEEVETEKEVLRVSVKPQKFQRAHNCPPS